MKLYTFSPVTSEQDLMKAIEFIHFECYKLCKQSFDEYLPNSGNVGFFCHYDDEYRILTDLRKELTESSGNVDQKYFRLHKPIIISSKDDVPETTYTFLYIRKPDPYRHHVGDIDFYLEQHEYKKLKKEMLNGKVLKGARVFERPDLDMIELYDPDIDALGYVSTEKMTKEVHVKIKMKDKLT
ncbi:MAG: hypothetical protein ABI721_00010 [Candidatus Dojkabacteria bacterium]